MNNNQNEVHVNVQKAGKTGLFTNYIFKAIPLAFDESLSYYECLCGLLNYLKNTVIPVLNNNADAIVTLQNNINEFETNINQEMANFKQTTNESIAIFEQSVNQTVQQLQNYVNNYFANLDVQDEINNKLDAMAEAGTLGDLFGGDGLEIGGDNKVKVKAGAGINVSSDGVNISPLYINDITVTETEFIYNDTKTTIYYSIIPSTYKPKMVMSDPDNPNVGKHAYEFDYEHK